MTIKTTDLAKEIGVDIDSLAKFFLLFSKIEFWAKKAGCYRSHTANPSVDLAAFAEYKKINFSNEQLREAKEYLYANPPQKQTMRNGKIVWENPKVLQESGPKELCTILGTIRNNLFHGGKYEESFGPDRNKRLIEYSNIILEYWLLSLN